MIDPPGGWDGVEVTESSDTVVWYDEDGEQHVDMAENWEEAQETA